MVEEKWDDGGEDMKQWDKKDGMVIKRVDRVENWTKSGGGGKVEESGKRK